MSKGWLSILILVLVAVPSFLYAIGMVELVDEVNLQTKTVGKVVFSHTAHGTSCGACHPKVFEKKRSNSYVSMKAMERGKSCGACHNGEKAFSVKGDCATCHAGDIHYKDTDAGDVLFSHTAHSGMFGCDACHPDLFKAERTKKNRASMEDMEKGKSCGACHDGATAFGVADCESCHTM
jgi:c(7)-type cytochrome triheme protein